MTLIKAVKRWLRRGSYHSGLGAWKHGPSKRWADIAQIADYRPTDHVLDVGCAEGMISFRVAKQVAHVHGIELMPERIARARREAERNQIRNVSFEIASASDYTLEPQSFDVVLLLSVLSKLKNASAFLHHALAATRRQVIIRIGRDSEKHARRGVDLPSILSALEQNGFEGRVFDGRRTRLIVGLKRGTDARLNDIPPDFQPY